MRLTVLLLCFLDVRGFASVSQAKKTSTIRLSSKIPTESDEVEESISRRAVLAATTAVGLNLYNVPPAQAFIQDVKLSNKKYTDPRVEAEALEAEYLEKVNSNGAPEKHIPKLTVSGTSVEVMVPHVMDAEKPHWIEYIWLKDVTNNKVLKAKQFAATDSSPPTMKATIKTKRITVRPFTYCNLHGLWQGEEVAL